MDCSGQYGALPAMSHVSHRGARALRWHTRNNLDSSDTTRVAAATGKSGSRGRVRSGQYASRGRPPLGNPLETSSQFLTQGREWCVIRPRSRADDEVDPVLEEEWKDITARDFPKAPLQAIALHDGMPVLRDDDTDPGMMQKGSEEPNFEMFGSSSLPFAQNSLQIRSPCQSKPTGIGSALRRRRTWSGAGR